MAHYLQLVHTMDLHAYGVQMVSTWTSLIGIRFVPALFQHIHLPIILEPSSIVFILDHENIQGQSQLSDMFYEPRKGYLI